MDNLSTSKNTTTVIILVGGFLAIVGIATFLIAVYGFITGTNPACDYFIR